MAGAKKNNPQITSIAILFAVAISFFFFFRGSMKLDLQGQ